MTGHKQAVALLLRIVLGVMVNPMVINCGSAVALSKSVLYVFGDCSRWGKLTRICGADLLPVH